MRVGVLVVLATTLTGAAAAQEADLEGIAFELGDPDAPVLVVEYADFACTACGEFARTTFPEIRREYVDAGRVRWQLVLFELGYRHSDEGARTGQCAARTGDFWAVHDSVYMRQDHWLDERRPKDRLIEVAVSTGIDEEAFRECWDDDPGEDDTKRSNRAARDDHVRATPTFFINGFRVQGALPAATFRELLDAALAGEAPGSPSRR